MVEHYVREHIALRAGEILLIVKPLYNSRFIGETVFRSCPKKRQRPHKIPQTRIFREIWIIKKLNIEAWLSLVERCVRDTIPNGSGKTCRIAETPYKQPLYRWHSI